MPVVDAPQDLQPSNDDFWDDMRALGDRDPLARLAYRVHETALDVCVDRSVRRICEAIESYADPAVVPRDDLWWSLYRNNETLCVLLVERRGLTPAELARRRSLGTRRAHQALPLTDLLRAFRLGYSTFWETLVDVARQLGSEVERELVDHAALLWSTLDEISSGVAEAHRAATSERDFDTHRRGMSFVNGLRNLPASRAATEDLARLLRLDPAGRFVVTVFSGTSIRSRTTGTGVLVDQPDRSILVEQPARPAAAVERELAVALAGEGASAVGVGLVHSGLDGAARSLDAAERAHATALALDRPVVLFRDCWLDCLVLESADTIDVLVGRAREMLQAEEEIRDTVKQFLDLDGKLIEAGKALFVHPNSVAYRLRRFAKLTGIDPRTVEGALLARVALTLAKARR